MTAYEQCKKSLLNGWKTWNNSSVLSHVMMPEGVGLSLGLKDYQQQKTLNSLLIGQDEELGTVTPRAHAYDDSFTDLILEWYNNTISFKTALDGSDLVILVTPLKQPKKPSALILSGINLWNRETAVKREGEVLILSGGNKNIPVYITVPHSEELFISCTTAYLSAELSCPIGISTGKTRTLQEITKIISKQEARWVENKSKYGKLSEAYSAMQTCQAWDTIYNPETDAPITTVSRIWNNRWGGYVLFCWDTYFAALMQSLDNKELAYCNAVEITHTVTENGFVPNFTAQGNFKTFDRSQPPVGSMTCLMIYKKYKEKWFLEEVYQNLLSWNQWFFNYRTTKNGLLAWGSNPYQSESDHKFQITGINEKQGAAWESGLDDSPVFDGIPFDSQNHIMLLEDVGLTGLYINDCYCLAEIAEILGDTKNSKILLERASKTEDRLEELWDEKTGMYLNRREDTGELQYRLSPFHFHALFSHKVGKKRAARMIYEHLCNPKEFWTPYIFPSISKSDPAYPEQIYFRGRALPPMNLLTYLAVKQYGFEEVEHKIAQKSVDLILKEWLEKGHVHETYDPETGEGCNTNCSDKFYHWGGLLSFIALYDGGYYFN